MRTIAAIDAHVAGEPIRVISPSQLELSGTTIHEKRESFIKNYDFLRKALIHEPRGHENMFGALICDSSHPEADIGLFFMDTKGYLNMCGHGTIGCVSVLLSENQIAPSLREKHLLVIETPAGLIESRFEISNHSANEVAFTNVPSFVYRSNASILLKSGIELRVDIVFSGSFFVLVNADQLEFELDRRNLKHFVTIAEELRTKLNQALCVSHPYKSHINSIDLTQFYTFSHSGHIKNCVVFGDQQVDRSPCGTGFSAMLAMLHQKGLLKVRTVIQCEGILGTQFSGQILEKTTVKSFAAVIPEISGEGFVTGKHEFILDGPDPFKHGFLL